MDTLIGSLTLATRHQCLSGAPVGAGWRVVASGSEREDGKTPMSQPEIKVSRPPRMTGLITGCDRGLPTRPLVPSAPYLPLVGEAHPPVKGKARQAVCPSRTLSLDCCLENERVLGH